jgi:hypothetical protein
MSMCQTTVSACTALFTQLGQTSNLPNCTALDSDGLDPTEDFYPIASGRETKFWCFELILIVYLGPPVNTSLSQSSTTASGYCVSDLLQIRSQNCTGPLTKDKNGVCALRCPGIHIFASDDLLFFFFPQFFLL